MPRLCSYYHVIVILNIGSSANKKIIFSIQMINLKEVIKTKGEQKMANYNNENKGPYINENFKDFAKYKEKHFAKEEKGRYDSKKEMRKDYMQFLIEEFLPDTIVYIVRNGHIKNEKIQTLKGKAYEKFTDKLFIKVLTKNIKNGDHIDNIELFPIIVRDILVTTEEYNKRLLAEDPNAKIYDMSDLVELSKLILKKKLKKCGKKGIDIRIAFDCLSIIPCSEAMKRSQQYRIHQFFIALYEHAKDKTIPFKEIMKVIVDEDYYSLFIVFALLERKEKFGNLTDSQKTFYLEVSNWVFDTMESMPEQEIKRILEVYINARQRDENDGRDGNRRYALTTLPENDYAKIRKVITALISRNENNKKYL